MHMTSAVVRTTDQIIILEQPLTLPPAPPPHKLFDYVDTIRVYPPSTPARSPNSNNAFDVMREHTCVCVCASSVYIKLSNILLL